MFGSDCKRKNQLDSASNLKINFTYMKNNIALIALIAVNFGFISCGSIKSTLKNVDKNAPDLVLMPSNTFILAGVSGDKKYGYNKDYPVNIYFQGTLNEVLNQPRYLDALAGPNGEKISYKKLENCCPFPSKNTFSGAGFLDVYEITWEGNTKPLKIYLNIYEKGVVMAPMGLTVKKIE
jgi:hypothetical protein